MKHKIIYNVIAMNNNQEKEPTNQEILEAINSFANHNESRLQDIETRMGGLETRMGGLEIKMSGLETRVVTKEYLDNKLADLKGDLVVLLRKEDTKVVSLIETLRSRQAISDEEAKHIL